MFYANWILISILLLIVHRVSLLTPSISLTPSYSSHNIVLVCDLQINEAVDGYIYLSCPFTNTGLCYSNCKETISLPMISNCVIEKIQSNHIVIKWTIDLTHINKSGDWQCSYRNTNSLQIALEKYKPKSGVTDISTDTKTFESSTLQVTTTVSSQVNVDSPKIHETNLYYHNTRNDFWNFITQPNSVLVLICVFTVSILLNIIFIIRCALFRSVIDNYLQAKKFPNSCLFRCFCIQVNQNLPTVNMKSLHQNNPSAYIAYHRDEIYDDMSSGSQADRHLINNYSHYELEHDSILSRKLWSSDGSHSFINRPPNICPGQPVGNYVIVTGPMCTNRNHVALNTPSNASLVSNSQNTYTTDAMGRSLSNEFQRPEYCSGSDNVIYSQPLKNRTRSFDPALNDEVSIKYMNNFKVTSPPPPPERNSNEAIHQSCPTADALTMNTVDLIEHYTQSTLGKSVEDKSC